MSKALWWAAPALVLAAMQPLWVMLAGGVAIVLLGLVFPVAVWEVLRQQTLSRLGWITGMVGGLLLGGLTALMGSILVAICLSHLAA